MILYLLEAGEQILADCYFVYMGMNLEIDESMLTGEADPIYKKKEEDIYPEVLLLAGEGYAKVTKVGRNTYSSKLADEARKFKIINSELQNQ